MQRRGFLKFALGGTVGLVASPAIWTTLYDLAYWTQNWGWIPRLKDGENLYIPTVSKLDGTPIKVRVVDERIIRTLGNKDNEMSKGGLTPLAASEAQLLYSESRVKRPLKRGPDGGYTYITWEEAESILKEKTKEAYGSCAFLNGDSSSSLNDVYSAFLAENDSQDYYFMPHDESSAMLAWHAMVGVGRVGFDIANSDFILSVGANFLDSWGQVAHNRAVFDETHPVEGEANLEIAYAGAMQNNTSVVADMWLPVKPGTEETFLYGILAELCRTSLVSGLPFVSLTSQYSLAEVSKICGTSEKAIKDVVAKLKNAHRPLVLCGTTEGQSLGTTVHMLAITINTVLGRINQDGGMVSLPMYNGLLASSASYSDIYARNFVTFCQTVVSGQKTAPKLLFINEANPVYALAKNAQVEECFAKIAYKVCFATHWSETCAVCDLVLPAAHGLERFDDVFMPYGSGSINWTIAKPVTQPRYYARPTGEVIIALAEELGINLGVRDIPSLLQMRAMQLGVDFKAYLESGDTYQESFSKASVPMISFQALSTKQMRKQNQSDIALLTYTNSAAGTPTTGIPPYANRAITAYQLQDGLCVAQMNKATAQKLGLADKQKAVLETENGRMPVLVRYYEGMMNDVVAVMVGLGHTEFDRFSTNKGNNILHFTQIEMEAGTDLPVWSSSVKVVKG